MNEEFVNEEEKEFNVYGDQAREELTANDEIDSDEDGFMKGYESEANPVYCDNCKKILERDHIEKEINSDVYSFCSDECVEEYERKGTTKS
jgi:hypothetical protein